METALIGGLLAVGFVVFLIIAIVSALLKMVWQASELAAGVVSNNVFGISFVGAEFFCIVWILRLRKSEWNQAEWIVPILCGLAFALPIAAYLIYRFS